MGAFIMSKLKKYLGLLLTSALVIALAGCNESSYNSDSSSTDPNTNSSPPAEPIPVTATRKINDTGITWGGNYPSGNNSTCVGEIIGEQDCSHGRDAQAGQAGFDFTRLNADGTEYTGNGHYTQAPWACVRDNHTGLVWEVKTPSGSGDIHDANNTYKWGGQTVLLNDEFGPRFNDWDTLVDGSNNARLCGFTDWRVPSAEELTSIVHYGRVSPVIDPTFFPNTRNDYYWSASPSAIHRNSAWSINFNDGDDGDDDRSGDAHVRLVRSGQ